MENHYLSQSLLPTSNVPTTRTSRDETTTTYNSNGHHHVHKLRSSNFSIVVTLLLIIFIGALSIWANYESSKTFEISIINNAKGSPIGHQFHLFYASNDKATRIILNASDFVQNVLYPKKINHVILTLISQSMTKIVEISSPEKDKYAITISTSLLDDDDINYALENAMHHAMAGIWLWNHRKPCIPAYVLEGMVEYITTLAGFGYVSHVGETNFNWWGDKDPKIVAQWLSFCEEQQKGFIQRFFEAMSECILDESFIKSATNSCYATMDDKRR